MAQIQQQMKATLERAGLPYRDIQCYGSQIVVTSTSEAAARKWALLLGKFAKVRGIVSSLDERKVAIDQPHDMSSTDNKYVRVFLTGAVISGSNRVSGKAEAATQHESAQTMAHSGSAAGVSSHPVQA